VYVVLKLVHVAAVILFLGNIVTGLFWKAHGDRGLAPPLVAHMLDGIIRSDRWFTLPGVLVIIASGVGMARIAHLPLLGTFWIAASLVLFMISGVAYAAQVAPLQTRMRALARQAGATGALDLATYRRLSLRWEIWGLVALVAPLVALGLMIFKPAAW
jgi:uncharacterized membrane protein